MARLLTVYQLWLDDLYPRAKFADGLAIIEKLGHTKRLQTMRKEWINEGKPREAAQDAAGARQIPNIQQTNSKTGQDQSPIADPKTEPQARATNSVIEANDDEFCAVSPKTRGDSSTKRNGSSLEESLFVSDEEETRDQLQDDDLEALIAEDEMNEAANIAFKPMQEQKYLRISDNFDDEMEVMTGLNDIL